MSIRWGIGQGLVGRLTARAAVWVALGCMLWTSVATAAPQGENVVSGTATFDRSGATTTITAGDRAIINYTSFDVAGNETVRFVQPNATATVLNRISSASPTHIDGSLQANGIVYLVNRAGVMFGPGSVVNVGGLYAAAANISNQDFLAGVNHFTDASGAVTNSGTIVAGAVNLIGQSVANYGSIVATDGLVTMVAGKDVLLSEQVGGHLMVRIEGTGEKLTDKPGVENTGTIDAGAGEVRLGAGDMFSIAARQAGTIKAKEVTVEGQAGVTEVTGTIDATGSTGGKVTVTGEKVAVKGATIDASGTNGGGVILIGGGYQGSDAGVANASQTFVNSGSVLKADAVESGNGGTIIVWSDLATWFGGQASIRGGASGGDGGFIETSSKGALNVGADAFVSFGAARGTPGAWLLDPTDVTLAAATLNMTGDPTWVPDAGNPDTGTVDIAAIEAVLELGGGGTVTVSTSPNGGVNAGDITVGGAITVDYAANGAPSTSTLTLNADNDIIVSNPISLSTTDDADDTFTLNLNAAGAVDINAAIGNTSGSGTMVLNATGTNFDNTGGTITTTGGAVSIDAGTGGVTVGAAIDAAAGTVHLVGDTMAIGAAVTGNGGITVEPSTATTPIGINAVVGMDLTTTELTNLVSTGTVTIGASGGTGAVTLFGADITASVTWTGFVLNGGDTNFTHPLMLPDNAQATFNTGAITNSTTTALVIGGANGTVSFNTSGQVVLLMGVNKLGASTVGGQLSLDNNPAFSTGLEVTGNVSAGDNNITLSSQTNALTVTGTLSAGAGSVTLTGNTMAINNTVTGNGGITVQPYTAAGTAIGIGGTPGGMDLDTTELGNLASTGTVTIGAAGGTGAVDIGSDAAVDLSGRTWAGLTVRGGAMTFTNTLTLPASATATLTGTSVTNSGGSDLVASGGTLVLTTTGAAAMNTTVGTLGATSTGGDLSITNTAALNVTGAVATTNDAVTLSSGTGALTIGNTIGAGSGDVNLAGSTVDINAAITGGTVRINSAGYVVQNATGAITATNLGVLAGGVITLNATTNHIGTFAAETTGAASAVALTDDSTLTVGTVSDNAAAFWGAEVSGITTNNGDVTISTGGNLSVGQTINAGTAAVSLTTTTNNADILNTAGGSTDVIAGSLTLATTGGGGNVGTNATHFVIEVPGAPGVNLDTSGVGGTPYFTYHDTDITVTLDGAGNIIGGWQTTGTHTITVDGQNGLGGFTTITLNDDSSLDAGDGAISFINMTGVALTINDARVQADAGAINIDATTLTLQDGAGAVITSPLISAAAGTVTINCDTLAMSAGTIEAGRGNTTGGLALATSAGHDLTVAGGTITNSGSGLVSLTSLQDFTLNGGSLTVTQSGGMNITATDNVILTSGTANATGTGELHVVATNGSVTDDGATNRLLGQNLVIEAGNGVGTVGNPLSTQVSNLAVSNAGSGLYVLNNGALAIGGAGGTLTVGGNGLSDTSGATDGYVTATSPIAINASVVHSGSFSYTADDTASGTLDSITINADVTLTSASDSTLAFRAGDDILQTSGTVLTNGGGNHTVTLWADHEGAVYADGHRGTINQTGGGLQTNALVFSADQGATLDQTNHATTVAGLVSGAGQDINYADTGDVAIGSGTITGHATSPINGLTAPGVIRINAGGGVSQTQLVSAGSLGVVAAGGNIVLTMANPVSTFAAQNTNGHGAVQFTNNTALSTGTVNDSASATLGGNLVGISTNSGDVTIVSPGNLTVTDMIQATGATVSLQTTGLNNDILSGPAATTDVQATRLVLTTSGAGGDVGDVGNVFTIEAPVLDTTSVGGLTFINSLPTDIVVILDGTGNMLYSYSTTGVHTITVDGLNGAGGFTTITLPDDSTLTTQDGAIQFINMTGVAVVVNDARLQTDGGNIDINGTTLTLQNGAGAIITSPLLTTAAGTVNVTCDALAMSAGIIEGGRGNTAGGVGIATTAGNDLTVGGGTIQAVGSGALQMNAGQNFVLSGGTLSATQTGAIQVTAVNDVTLTSGSIQNSGTGNTQITPTNDFLLNGASVSTSSTGNIQINPPGNLTLTSGTVSSSGAGVVQLSPTGNFILNGATVSSTAAGPIQITPTGDVTLTAGTVNSSGTGEILVTTGGSITDSDATARLIGSDLRLDAVNGVGTVANPLNTQVTGLAVRNTTAGGIYLANTGALAIGGAGGALLLGGNGVTDSSGAADGFIQTASPLAINASAAHVASFTYQAGDSGGAGDDLTINAAVTLTAAGDSTLAFVAGDSILHTSGAVSTAGGGTHTVALWADHEADGLGGISQTGGGIQTNTLVFSASDAVSLTQTNHVDTLAGVANDVGEAITYNDTGSFTIGSGTIPGIGAITALTGQSNVTITATGSVNDAQDDTAVDITGLVVTITTGSSIGGTVAAGAATDTLQALDIASTGLDLSATGAGGEIVIRSVGGTDLTDLDTLDSQIVVVSNASLTVGNVTAGTGTPAPADISTSFGTIMDSAIDTTTDIQGSDITLSAGSAIVGGSGLGDLLGALEVDGTNLDLTTTGIATPIRIYDPGAGATNLVAGTTAGGALTLSSAGPLAVTGAVATSGGTVTLSATEVSSTVGGTIATTGIVNTGMNSGSVSITSTGGDMTNLLGPIVTTGAANNGGDGGDGGAVRLATTDGAITTPSITTSGGAATAGTDNGGDAGDVNIVAADAGSDEAHNVVLHEAIVASGGATVGGTAGAGGVVRVNADNDLTQDVALTAESLGVLAGGSVTLTQANHLGAATFAASATGAVAITNDEILTIGRVADSATPTFGVAQIDGITTVGGNIDITSNNGSVVVLKNLTTDNGGGVAGDITINVPLTGALRNTTEQVGGDPQYWQPDAVIIFGDGSAENIVVSAVGSNPANSGTITLGGALPDVPGIATIWGKIGTGQYLWFHGGTFLMGQNAKLTCSASVYVYADNATVGDMAAMTNLVVRNHDGLGNSIITYLRRAPGNLVRSNPDNSFLDVFTDEGLDFVAGTFLYMPGAGVLAGAGPDPTAVAPGGASVFRSGPPELLAGALANIYFDEGGAGVRVAPDGTELWVLDAAERGVPAVSNLATALASALPGQEVDVSLSRGVDASQREELVRHLGIYTKGPTFKELVDYLSGRRFFNDAPASTYPTGAGDNFGAALSPADNKVSIDRLPADLAQQALAKYRQVYWRKVVDPKTKKEIWRSVVSDLRKTIEKSVDAYKSSHDGKFDPVDYRKWAASTADQKRANELMTQLEDLFRKIELLGLGPVELDISFELLARSVKPRGLSVQETVAMIRNMPVAAGQGANGTVTASR